MTEDRTKDIKGDALSIMAQICDKGYTLEDMAAFICWLEILSRQISDNAKERATMKEYFPSAAQLKISYL